MRPARLKDVYLSTTRPTYGGAYAPGNLLKPVILSTIHSFFVSKALPLYHTGGLFLLTAWRGLGTLVRTLTNLTRRSLLCSIVAAVSADKVAPSGRGPDTSPYKSSARYAWEGLFLC